MWRWGVSVHLGSLYSAARGAVRAINLGSVDRMHNCLDLFVSHRLSGLHQEQADGRICWLGCQDHHCWWLLGRVRHKEEDLWKMEEEILWRAKPHEPKCTIQTLHSKRIRREDHEHAGYGLRRERWGWRRNWPKDSTDNFCLPKWVCHQLVVTKRNVLETRIVEACVEGQWRDSSHLEEEPYSGRVKLIMLNMWSILFIYTEVEEKWWRLIEIKIAW